MTSDVSYGSDRHRIGRYEVVGRLATGGMAEIFLGRLHGPHGFESPVVIKRILPHLAIEPHVVDLFLDEARTIANLRHPNLIHVHELGSDRGELFLAMEYLEGESAAGLCRRLARRDEYLDFELAAHIVAEACAGLHAAHEAKSPDGRPLEIVHRDVSPQNIFVSYSGAVHVIDFGIATSVDRVGRTDAGKMRGKVEYVAPEQVEGLACDRRADVFSLGVVLFELASGRRLFKRASAAEAMMAILNEQDPALTAFRPDTPQELADICARALVRNRRERIASAAEMRRELLGFIRKSTDEDVGERLAERMKELFPDRIEEKADMLRRVRRGGEVSGLPPAEVDAAVELPTVAERTAVSRVSEPRPRKRRPRWVLGAFVVAAGVASALAIALRASPRAEVPAPPIDSAIPSAIAQKTPVPESSAGADPSPSVPPHVASSASGSRAPILAPPRKSPPRPHPSSLEPPPAPPPTSEPSAPVRPSRPTMW